MPLLDHFHPPLSLTRHWESIYAQWAASLPDSLNRGGLPPGMSAAYQSASMPATPRPASGPSFNPIPTGDVAVRLLSPLAALLLLAPDVRAVPFALADGDRVVFLGNTLIEREQRSGYWE